LRDDDPLEARRAFHHRVIPPRLALDVLAANWTNKFKLAHAVGNSISYLRATGNGVFKEFLSRVFVIEFCRRIPKPVFIGGLIKAHEKNLSCFP
jgi:hypothetical protein